MKERVSAKPFGEEGKRREGERRENYIFVMDTNCPTSKRASKHIS